MGVEAWEEMTETLSDDARLVLAFIRDHPGLWEVEIWKQLGFDKSRLVIALKQLHKANLIISHAAAGKITYYPA